MNEKLTHFLEKISYSENHDPRLIRKNKVKIDEKIKNSILKINESNWVWTLWSCQGHLSGYNKGSLPYLVFIVKKEFLGSLLLKIYQSIPYCAKKELPLVNGPFSYTVTPGYTDENFSIVSLHYSYARGTLVLNEIQQSINNLADSITEENYG